MKYIFEPVDFGSIHLKNRLIRSATLIGGEAVDGLISSVAIKDYTELAESEVGLIITSMVGVCPGACASEAEIRAYADGFTDSMAALSSAVHNKGGKIVAQIAHCGAKSAFLDTAKYAESPSGISMIPELPIRELTQERIAEIVCAFAETAQKCKEAGVDGVQIHAAHGYLISQFLCPVLNKRTDEYGGTLENRARFLLETLDAIREKTGPEFPVLVKLNCKDLVENGMNEDESLEVCRMLERHGADAVELSVGVGLAMDSRPVLPGIKLESQGPFAAEALRFSAELKMPVATVCGYRSPEYIEELLNRGDICTVSMCRPFIREPGIAKRWKSGDLRPSDCVSCNRCGAGERGCKVKKR